MVLISNMIVYINLLYGKHVYLNCLCTFVYNSLLYGKRHFFVRSAYSGYY